MKLSPITPAKSLNKAYLKQPLKRQQIETFKTNLDRLFNRINEDESEEHLKNIVSDFLKDTYYKETNEINTKNKEDLVIHNGKSSSDTVGVIIEAKRPANKAEMISKSEANTKAFQELVLYYLKETVEGKNHEIKHLIVTNIWEWFVFDAVWFEKNIDRNTKLNKDYEQWKLSGHDTKHFYDHIASKHLGQIEDKVPCTYFNLKEYEDIILNDKKEDDASLVNLYKILSSEHLLKKPFVNDSNSLNKEFYGELLHIIGLAENKDGNKKTIERKKEEDRDEGSLLENTIRILKVNNKLKKVGNSTQYGENENEQLFSIGLELCITWLNRILFLKLLEGQLIKYHRGNKEQSFLNAKRIADYDELNEMFFEVLAVPVDEREQSVKEKFSGLPYLNSSLFEETNLESDTIVISALKGRFEIPLYHQTILKESKGKRITGTKKTLEYLFEFLDAYDFASDSGESIQEENKSIINASVLGLIFEKINGYKDGSFFTPGFITMYMCRETIRKAVAQKFKDSNFPNCKNVEGFNDLQDKIDHTDKAQREKANTIINTLKICDPAVGSGHFLVSALNEIIAIKSELQILSYRDGSRVKGFKVVIENDELIITNEEDDSLFDYRLNTNGKPIDELQQLQEALFHEKQTIIENCLFGVDINPKSVMICRLRLWIELLKNSYYTSKSKFKHLETLPNIDINIKTGNSLISRYDVNADLGEVFKKDKNLLSEYRIAVATYKNSTSKEAKRKLQIFINSFKEKIVNIYYNNNPLVKTLSKYKGQLVLVENKVAMGSLFEKLSEKDIETDVNKLKIQIKKTEQEIEDAKNNKLYDNAFEWRFEFPEVLDEDGRFTGFDVVIGNPPYIPLEEFTDLYREWFRKKYSSFVERKFETSVLFILEGLNKLQPNGLLGYIAPITWQTGENYSLFRKHLFEQRGIHKIINLPFDIFEDAYVETAIYHLSMQPTTRYGIHSFDKKVSVNSLDHIVFTEVDQSLTLAPKYKIILNSFVNGILNKFDPMHYTTLGAITISTQGLAGSNFKPVKKSIPAKHYPFLQKGNVYNYTLQVEKTFITSLEDMPSLKVFYDAKPKILIRRIVNRQDRLSVGFTEKRMVFKKDINPFIITDKEYNTKFVLAVMASRLISYIYLNISSISSKDDFRQTTLAELREIPIPKIKMNKQRDFAKIAERILLKKEKNINIDTSDLEKQIDEMVYKIYGLTKEEIEIVEGKQ